MNKREATFVETVLSFYRKEGRHALPWRHTTDPYHILVSEVMLQQTQVERVIPKYEAFIQRWPTVQDVAQAPLRDVLVEWQGLGYNRRAKFLHECAKVVVRDYGGAFPHTYEQLVALPGIGRYTAGAVLAFAFNVPVPVIETNIRTVYIYHFFRRAEAISDADILKLVARTIPPNKARMWYAALMDYGTYLKRTTAPVHRRSKHYKKQAPFKGSLRAVRGAIMRILTTVSTSTIRELAETIEVKEEHVRTAIAALKIDGLIVMKRGKISVR